MNDNAPAWIEEVTWQTHREALMAVRQAVFVEEQSVPPAEEWDALDAACAHVLALDGEGRPVGTARLQPDGRIGRLAVLPAWRGRGLGTELMHKMLDLAAAAGHDEALVWAQTRAEPFYRRLGFVAEGPEFLDAGIPHHVMRRPL